jgi:murein DD-endopeptidase MepM/ murein hydrolase activator NlpD
MEFQFHPASGRGRVRTLVLGPRGERVLIALAGAAAALGWSLLVSVPGLASRRLRRDSFVAAMAESRNLRDEDDHVARFASALRARALDHGDLFNRIAFLYGIEPAGWPRLLNPQRPWLSAASAQAVAKDLPLYQRALRRASEILELREEADPARAAVIPSILPVEAGLFEPAARFGPRLSPWTGEEEFFPGVDIAAPAGASVVSPGAGTVVFTGNVRRTRGGWLWRLGNVVVISHGESGATVFGHLARIDVRRGQPVKRGDRIGSVGATGWALSPQLHYELWRSGRDGLRPTDPLFAALDQRSRRNSFSLEQMLATSAPLPLEPLPGIQISAERVRGGPDRSIARRPHRHPARAGSP